ncbi:CaiB/BaiF CoA transferase family protein [Extensimonas perlucida]|uniref:CaiB/BaiF CoA transferase family protein n=1 Tax=Extensimonas perlucida TaxID=2590786 RepID=UPI0011A060C9|nr:CaiB/BaiF CoA-transferase family protein [Extensimonas perlucida]
MNSAASASATASAPLAGLTVLDLTELLPGPYATQQMVEMGATVIKVERPGGDNARGMFPGLFSAVNRGKKSIVLDLKTDADRATLQQLAQQADVLIEGYRPDVTARLGIDYASLSALNPRLIYCSISGYGQTGPARLWPGHDLNYAGMAGVVALSGHGSEPDYSIGIPVGDLAAAMYALVSILGALHSRASTQKGQYLDVAITDALASWVVPRLGVWNEARQKGEVFDKSKLMNHPGYGIFRTQDRRHITIGAIETPFWRRLVQALQLQEFADPAYEDFATRSKAYDAITAALAQRIATQSYAHWAALLESVDVPYGPLNTLDDLADDPQLKARGLVQQIGKEQMIAFPVPMQGIAGVAQGVPALGAHQAEVLQGLTAR